MVVRRVLHWELYWMQSILRFKLIVASLALEESEEFASSLSKAASLNMRVLGQHARDAIPSSSTVSGSRANGASVF